MITQKELKELVSYNPTTGVMSYWATKGIIKAGNNIGKAYTNHSGKSYMRVTIKQKPYFVHRLIWLYMHGHFPTKGMDHINGNGIDNRLSNLREATCLENARNLRKYITNTSGSTGIKWIERLKKWKSVIFVNRKSIYIGIFKHKNDAIFARKEAEIKYGFHENHGAVRPL